MGMKSNPTWTSLDLGLTYLDILYSRFGRDDGYYIYDYEFECSVEEWEKYRLDAFAIVLLGSLIFPKSRGRIDTCLRYVVLELAQRGGEPRKTIVPMILVEIMRSLSACVDGRMFFEGCNLLLQLWAVDHFHKQSDVVDNYLGQDNNLDNHPRRLARFAAPVGFVDWQIFLTELERHRIQWKLHWLSTPNVIVRWENEYFIEIICFKGVQPYVPLRVLWQFGQTQVIPLRSDMEQFKYEFGIDKPQFYNILRRWKRVLTILMGTQ